MFEALFLIGALLGCVVAAWLAHSYWRVRVLQWRRSGRTVGTIVETWVEIVEHEDGDYERRFATVAFETPDGLYRQRVQLLRSMTVAGQRVPVRYDPADPTNFSLNEPKTVSEAVGTFILAVVFEVWIIWIIVSAFLFGLLVVWLSAQAHSWR
jgi:hypothetical protein